MDAPENNSAIFVLPRRRMTTVGHHVVANSRSRPRTYWTTSLPPSFDSPKNRSTNEIGTWNWISLIKNVHECFQHETILEDSLSDRVEELLMVQALLCSNTNRNKPLITETIQLFVTIPRRSYIQTGALGRSFPSERRIPWTRMTGWASRGLPYDTTWQWGIGLLQNWRWMKPKAVRYHDHDSRTTNKWTNIMTKQQLPKAAGEIRRSRSEEDLCYVVGDPTTWNKVDKVTITWST